MPNARRPVADGMAYIHYHRDGGRREAGRGRRSRPRPRASRPRAL